MASADFDQAIAESHAATDGVLKGNPDGFKALYSRSEDITLGNPFGGFARGWDQVAEQLERASSYYRDGEATGFEPVARAVGSELAYTVELERARPRLPAAPTSGSSLFELRRSIATKRTVGGSSIVMPIPGSPARPPSPCSRGGRLPVAIEDSDAEAHTPGIEGCPDTPAIPPLSVPRCPGRAAAVPKVGAQGMVYALPACQRRCR